MLAWLSCVAMGGLLGAAPGDRANVYGVALGLYPKEAKLQGFDFPPDLKPVRELGAKAVLLPVPIHQRSLRSVSIRRTFDGSSLRAVIRRARPHLRVALMPFIVLEQGRPKDWRGRLQPEDRAAWWRSYRAIISGYAALAKEEGIWALVIGSELSGMQGPADASQWKRLSKEVRARFSGELVYVSNHDALDLRAPFAHVDLAGVSAYFPLARRLNASEEDMRAAWREIGQRLQRFGRSVQKPIWLFEIGYPSVDGGAVEPWNDLSSAPVDLEEQRRAYAASVDFLRSAPWIGGAFYWIWFGPGGPFDRSYTPRGKPAEAELERLFHAR